MADQNLPDPTPAPNPAPTPGSVPDPKPADDKPVVPTPPAASAVTLTDDQRTYLKGQGLTDEELNSPDAIAKIITHAQSSQQTASKLKNALDKAGLSLTPETPANPFGVPGTPGSSSQPQPNPTPTPAPQGGAGIDQATAFLLTNQLATSFPLVKDDLVSGKFYQDMQALGIPMKTADGQINLQGLTTYGKMQQEARENAAKLAEANKPDPNAIPDAATTTPTQPAADSPMTKQMAQAILLQDPNHARAAEAKTFLQSNLGKK
jgi:hypothetical protein